MNFFMDRNMSPKMAQLIEVFDRENQVRHLDDDFPQDMPDTGWLNSLGKRTPKPAVISGDARILRNNAEMQALREAGLAFFLMAKGWINFPWTEKQAWMMIKVWPQIVTNASPTRPTIYEVAINLKVERRYLTDELGRQRLGKLRRKVTGGADPTESKVLRAWTRRPGLDEDSLDLRKSPAYTPTAVWGARIARTRRPSVFFALFGICT